MHSPCPPMSTTYALHLPNCISENSTKSTCQRCTTKEDCNSPTALVSAVIHREDVDDTWEETCFCNTQDYETTRERPWS